MPLPQLAVGAKPGSILRTDGQRDVRRPDDLARPSPPFLPGRPFRDAFLAHFGAIADFPTPAEWRCHPAKLLRDKA